MRRQYHAGQSCVVCGAQYNTEPHESDPHFDEEDYLQRCPEVALQWELAAKPVHLAEYYA